MDFKMYDDEIKLKEELSKLYSYDDFDFNIKYLDTDNIEVKDKAITAILRDLKNKNTYLGKLKDIKDEKTFIDIAYNLVISMKDFKENISSRPLFEGYPRPQKMYFRFSVPSDILKGIFKGSDYDLLTIPELAYPYQFYISELGSDAILKYVIVPYYYSIAKYNYDIERNLSSYYFGLA